MYFEQASRQTEFRDSRHVLIRIHFTSLGLERQAALDFISL